MQTWYGWREIALLEEMYTRICEENGPADPVLQGVVSEMALLAESGGDLDRAERWASVAADNLRSTYATVILVLNEGWTSEMYYTL
jgi:hypothetical protein